MTWYFDPGGTTMDVYDHEGATVATRRSFGGSWDTERGFPDEVLDVMQEVATVALDDGEVAYAIECAMHAAFEDIEAGAP